MTFLLFLISTFLVSSGLSLQLVGHKHLRRQNAIFSNRLEETPSSSSQSSVDVQSQNVMTSFINRGLLGISLAFSLSTGLKNAEAIELSELAPNIQAIEGLKNIKLSDLAPNIQAIERLSNMIHIEMPKSSKLLTTTQRLLETFPLKEKKSLNLQPLLDSVKTQLSELDVESVVDAIKPTLNELEDVISSTTTSIKSIKIDDMKSMISSTVTYIRNFPRDWRFFGGAAIAIILAEAINRGNDINRIVEEQEKIINSYTQNGTLPYNAYIEEIDRLSKELSSFEEGMKNITEQLSMKSDELDTVKKMLNMVEDADSDFIKTMRDDAVRWQNEYKEIRMDFERYRSEEGSNRSEKENSEKNLSEMKLTIEELKSSEDSVLSAIRKFVVDQGYMEVDVANMMVVSESAPQIIQELSTSSLNRMSFSDNMIKELRAQLASTTQELAEIKSSMKRLEERTDADNDDEFLNEIELLTVAVEDLKSDNVILSNQVKTLKSQLELADTFERKAKISAITGDAAPILNQLATENDALRKSLIQSEKKLLELLEKSEQFEKRETKLVETFQRLENENESIRKQMESVLEYMKSEGSLKEVSRDMVKKKKKNKISKSELERNLSLIGITKSIDGRPVSQLLRSEMVALLKNKLSQNA